MKDQPYNPANTPGNLTESDLNRNINLNSSNANDKNMINGNKNGKTERDRKANISTHDDPSDKCKDSVLVQKVVVNQSCRSLALSFSLITSDLDA